MSEETWKLLNEQQKHLGKGWNLYLVTLGKLYEKKQKRNKSQSVDR